MASFLTKSFIVCKARPSGWTVFHARPGSNKKEAWDNACDVARLKKKEFVAAGWECHPIYICSVYGLPKGKK